MPQTTIIDAECLAVDVQNPDWVVCDCRFSLQDADAGARAYAESHIPGAHYLHLDGDLSGPRHDGSGRHPLPDPQILARRLGDIGIGAGTQVAAYDQGSGFMAARLWWLLRWLGHEAVAVLDGGWQRWRALDLPVSAATPESRPRTLSARANRYAWLSTGEVEQGLARGDFVLVDARSAERFRGDHEPIDSVAGHVPGARNHPCEANLERSARLRPPSQLRAAFQNIADDAGVVVHMCGSGVTARHNQLAMEVAGLPGSRLYVGSWSEWILDPARPVAKGP